MVVCPRDERGRLLPVDPMQRFLSKCQFQPETGCVVWTGAKTKGRGHHIDYGSFWFERRSWFAHRWAAKYIHGQVIEGFDVDHYCPALTIPNTLCVEHVRSETPERNRQLQTMRRMIHLQVGLINYEDVYGPMHEDFVPIDTYDPPSWLGADHARPSHRPDPDECPF